MWWRLQPYVMEAATLFGGGCTLLEEGQLRVDGEEQVYLARLQPYVMETATLCDGRCSPM